MSVRRNALVLPHVKSPARPVETVFLAAGGQNLPGGLRLFPADAPRRRLPPTLPGTGGPATMTVPKRKVFAYLTHRDATGERLLVFSHPNAPAAGIQVPAGTVEDGESPEAAVLREGYEETGLADLVLVRFLGERVRDMADAGRDEVHHRFFFHLRCSGTPPERWQHWEEHPSEAPGARHLFECFWARLPDGVPVLATGHDALLPELLAHLAHQP